MCNDCGNLTHTDPLDDALDGLYDVFGEDHQRQDAALREFYSDFNLSGEQKAGYDAASDPVLALHYEPCKKCGGSGKFHSYTGRVVGNCFTCKGAGKIGYKQSAETRAAKRDSTANRQQAAVNEWVSQSEENGRLYGWLIGGAAQGNQFYGELLAKLQRYGSLTERQMAAVQRDIDRDAARAEEKASIERNAPTIAAESLDRITTAFARAIDRQIQQPKMRLDTFLFSAVRSGVNAGAIYVKSAERGDDGERSYLGKIVEGRFIRSRDCNAEDQQRIIAAASDPEAAAKAYGQRTGTCSICGRKLTKAESIDRAVGPICLENMGW